jgi:opacity protein-like surface antigen
LVIAFGLVSSVVANATAQERPFHFNIGGGPTFGLGDVGDRFGVGWGPALGITIDATERIGIQFEYAFRYFWLKESVDIGARRFDANHSTHQLAFNLVGNLTEPDSPVRAYVTAGPGFYYRKVEITEYEGTGIICDPWFYVCGAVPISSVVGSRGGWDFGLNVGGGVAFKVGEPAEFFIESRYHYVWGPEFAGASEKSNGQYWPLTFGIRF